MQNELGRYNYKLNEQAYYEESRFTKVEGEGGSLTYTQEMGEGISGNVELRPGYEAIIGVNEDGSTYHYLQKVSEKNKEEEYLPSIWKHESSGIIFDLERQEIAFPSKVSKNMSPKESVIIEKMINNNSNTLSTKEYAEEMYPGDQDAEKKAREALKVYVRRFRMKLEEEGIEESVVETMRGKGYKLSGDLTRVEN